MTMKYLTCLSTFVGAGIGIAVGCGGGALLSFIIDGNVESGWMVMLGGYIGMMIGGGLGCILSGPRATPDEDPTHKHDLETISFMAPGYNISPSALERLGLPPEPSMLSLREPVPPLPLTPSKSSAPPSLSPRPKK